MARPRLRLPEPPRPTRRFQGSPREACPRGLRSRLCLSTRPWQTGSPTAARYTLSPTSPSRPGWVGRCRCRARKPRLAKPLPPPGGKARGHRLNGVSAARGSAARGCGRWRHRPSTNPARALALFAATPAVRTARGSTLADVRDARRSCLCPARCVPPSCRRNNLGGQACPHRTVLFRTGRPANQQSISQPELNYAETFQQGGLDLSGYMNANNNTSALPLLAEAEPAEPPQAGHTVKAH